MRLSRRQNAAFLPRPRPNGQAVGEEDFGDFPEGDAPFSPGLPYSATLGEEPDVANPNGVAALLYAQPGG